ncbi:hypothetical protein Gpo141_00010805 [Globisporangium polare]
MAHDRAFLERCEAFLLHPAVRALSLAQRVDFLEQKGLSPEEITACLKNIQLQNGLSKMLTPATAASAAAGALDSTTGALVAKRSATTTWTGVIMNLLKRYGVVTLMTMLLGYGYIRFRQKATEQLMIKMSLERVQRRTRRATKVEGMLGLISDQQAQYQQAAKLLQSRVAKFQEAKRAAEAPSASTVSAAALVRKIELESLQKELSHLKSAVVDTFIHPQSEATETEESGVEPVETHATAAAEVPASDAKSSGIKLSLTPREQTSSSSSAIFDCVTADSLVGDDEESSMTSKTPFMLSS